MDRFYLRMLRGTSVTNQKSDLSTAANSILACVDVLAVWPVELENYCNPVAEFAALFHKEIPMESPPVQKINHKIKIIPASSGIPTHRPARDTFK